MFARRPRTRSRFLAPSGVVLLGTVAFWVACACTVAALVGCDGTLEDRVPESPSSSMGLLAPSDDIREPARARARPPLRSEAPEPGVLDPCADYGDNPGVTLTNGTEFEGKVLLVDYCQGTVSNLAGCWVSNHWVDLGDLQYETDEVDLRCDFACVGGDQSIAFVAGYPPPGNEVRVEWANPCAPEVAP